MPTPTTLVVLTFLLYFDFSQCEQMSSLVVIACRRRPSLSFCQNSTKEAKEIVVLPPDLPSDRSKDQPISENDRLIMEDIAKAVKRTGGNPFETKPRRTRQDNGRKDSDLREKDTENDEGFIAEEGESQRQSLRTSPREEEEETTAIPTETTTEDTEEHGEHGGFRGDKGRYCDSYEQHFSFYCIGEQTIDGNEEMIAKFCPSYKKACPFKSITTKSLTVWPSNPFSAPVKTKAAFKETKIESEETSEETEVTEQELYYAELKKRFPCKPDCDQRLFPHCTAECKCDYLYPMVQRFCNPPPMPLFLNTCRLWYNGCPKYEAYHYSSQFVYSKAEKGKRLPGQPQPTNPNPYNIPQPTRRFRAEAATAHLQPLARGAVTSSDLVIPPELPSNYKEIQENRRLEEERVDVFERTLKKNKKKTKSLRRKTNFEISSTPPPPPSKKELFRTLKALSALTADPARLTKDIIGQGGSSSSSERPKAKASNSFPVVASDAAYGADDTFNRFDGLTDSRGILHRPRSSSPFTKPGLWEPNPADPHNRDHANKYYYHPRSVGVDWLNGQMTWGAHWAVPAAGVGGTDGFSALHFPSVGTFLNIPDDYD